HQISFPKRLEQTRAPSVKDSDEYSSQATVICYHAQFDWRANLTARTDKELVAADNEGVTTRQVVWAFAALFLLNLLLRVFYLRYDFVNGDEGVRALTAIRMLDGAQLYADVVTDKPPGASLF